MINDLRKWGWTQTRIAEYCGCTQANISWLEKDTSDPKYSIGVALTRLHKRERRKRLAARK